MLTKTDCESLEDAYKVKTKTSFASKYPAKKFFQAQKILQNFLQNFLELRNLPKFFLEFFWTHEVLLNTWKLYLDTVHSSLKLSLWLGALYVTHCNGQSSGAPLLSLRQQQNKKSKKLKPKIQNQKLFLRLINSLF